MVIIQNDFLTVAINKKGAEIKSVKGKNGTEFMWCANPDIWGSSAPMAQNTAVRVINLVLDILKLLCGIIIFHFLHKLMYIMIICHNIFYQLK